MVETIVFRSRPVDIFLLGFDLVEVDDTETTLPVVVAVVVVGVLVVVVVVSATAPVVAVAVDLVGSDDVVVVLVVSPAAVTTAVSTDVVGGATNNSAVGSILPATVELDVVFRVAVFVVVVVVSPTVPPPTAVVVGLVAPVVSTAPSWEDPHPMMNSYYFLV